MALTPGERLARMGRLRQSSFALLAANPEALDRFWRRNLRQRAARLRATARGVDGR